MRILFFGTPDFAVPTLRALLASSHEVVGVVTQPDRPKGRGQKIAPGAVAQVALDAGLPLLQPVKLADAGVREALAAFGADLGVVAAYGKILPAWLLALPPAGMINVHASLLPAWRGAAPVHRAVMAGDAETGVTIMRVVQALDAGAMLDRVVVPIAPDVTSDVLEHTLAEAGAARLVAVVDRLAGGPIEEVPQDESRVTYAAKITRGDSPLDWRAAAQVVHDRIRGLHPWPHASASIGGTRLILHRSTLPGSPTAAAPGTIVAAGSAGVDVAAGDGHLVRLLVLQAEGGKRLGAAEFLAGRPLAPGMAFDLVIAPARRAAFAALVEIARGRADLDDALDRARQSLSDARDVGLLREIVTGTLRWQSRLDWRLAPLTRVALAKLDVEVLVALRMSAYQLEHLDRIPASAVVHDAVALVRAAKKSSAAGLVNAVLRALTRAPGAAPPVAAADASRAEIAAALAVSTAHPAWLIERWLAREPREVVEAWLAFDNDPPPTALRVNPLAGASRDAVAARLAADGIVTTPAAAAPLGLVVRDGLVVAHPALREGLCGIQDEGSQLAALVAPVTAGARVLDVCAAPGGKTLAYAWAAGANGSVVACDVRERRLDVLRETLRRGHAGRVEVVTIDEHAPLPFAAVFDVVAVDAPCSGLGTLRRDPDIKWRRTPEDLQRFQARQIDLLTRAAAVVAPGGALVYTTCSTEPDENIDVVTRVLATVPGFTLRRADAGPDGRSLTPFVEPDGCLRTHPVRHGLEGYFGAVLVRRPDGPPRRLLYSDRSHMPLRTRVWTAGRLLLIAGGLAATYLVFAAIAVRVAVRARDVVVPDVTGATVRDASTRLAQDDLVVRVDPAERPSLDVPAGHVLGQDPRPGTSSRRQRTVRVWLSAGPRVAYMPQLVGESERSATIRLSQEGLDAPLLAEIRSVDFSADQVVAQEPPAGRPAASVHLLVSRGADVSTYVMPDLIGLGGEAAAAVLRQQGFRVSFVAQQASSGLPAGLIVRQTPAGGYQVQPGAAISLEVAQ